MLEEHDLLIPKDLSIEEEARIAGKEVWRTGLTGEMEIYMPALAREKQDTEARSITWPALGTGGHNNSEEEEYMHYYE